jgi:cysteine desulfurase
MKPIYLDNFATTRLDQRVLEAMMPYLTEEYGNPSSRTHRYGWKAEEAIENAREQVARLINADSNQIIFTSGATEANMMAVNNGYQDSFLMSAIEHSSIKNSVEENWGEEIRINKKGVVDLNHIKYLLDGKQQSHNETEDIFVMMVNNEIGTIQPIKAIREMAPWHASIHSDMAQALGKVKIDVQDLNVDSASFSSHKIYGPKGIGAIYIKEPENFRSLIRGGNQEFGMRAGTQNVPGIVGFGKACEIVTNVDNGSHIKFLNDLFKEKLKELVPNIVIHKFSNTVAGAVNVAVPCKDMDVFMTVLEPNVAVSFGSACMSLHNASSYVLKAVSIPEEEILRSIRIGIGKYNTSEEMEQAAQHIAYAVKISNTME